MHTQIRRPV